MPPFLLDPRHRARLFSAIWGLAGALVLAVGWWLWHFPADRWAHESHVMELTDAEALASARATPPDDLDNGVSVRLPHRWSQTHRELTGSLWYRLNAPLSALPPQTWAVYVPMVVWDSLSFLCIVWAQLSLCLFFLRFSERQWAWAERFILGFALLAPIVVALIPSQMLVGLIYLVIYLVALVGFALALWHAYRARRPDRNLFAFGSLVSIPAAAHDVALQLNQLSLDSVYMLPYGGPVMVGCMAFIVAGEPSCATAFSACHRWSKPRRCRPSVPASCVTCTMAWGPT